MRISGWSSDVCSSDLFAAGRRRESEDHQREIHSDPFSALSSNHWLSSPTGRPVAMPRLPSPLAVPATSRCAQRWPSVKRDRKQPAVTAPRSEEHTSELQSLMRTSYAVFCLKKKNIHHTLHQHQ